MIAFILMILGYAIVGAIFVLTLAVFLYLPSWLLAETAYNPS